MKYNILVIFCAFSAVVLSPNLSFATNYAYFAVSFDSRLSFKVWDSTQSDTGWRPIASSKATDHGGSNGVWYYNSNTMVGATDVTWTACTVNSQDNCIAQAMGVTANQMDTAEFQAITGAQWEDMGGWSYFTRSEGINVSVGLMTTSSSTTPVVDEIQFTYTAGSMKPIFRSVEPGASTVNPLAAGKTGTGNDLTVSGVYAAFAKDLPHWVGVGDALQYDSDNNGTIDAIAFISRRDSPRSYIVASTAGGTPTATSAADKDWTINRMYSSLSNAEAGTKNAAITVTTDTWTAGRALTTNSEIWNIALYGREYPCGTATVSYEGKTYTTVKIGTQCWMGENLNVGTRVNGSVTMTDDGTLQKYCYSDTESYCTSDGGLYQWNEAMRYVTTAGVRGICPDGWRIPTDGDWYALENYLKTGTCDSTRVGWDCDPAGTALKSGGSTGFNALLGGERTTALGFADRDVRGKIWSSTGSSTAYFREVISEWSTIRRITADVATGFSVRCLKD